MFFLYRKFRKLYMQTYFTNSITTIHGRHLAFEWDAKGLPITDGQGRKTAFVYDPLGRVTKYRRDADLRVTLLTDPLGRNTTFTYDLSGNVTAVTNPAGFATKFSYGSGACPSCAGGQLSALTDPKGNTWTFGYDQYGRLANAANPLGQRRTYEHDKMSRVTEVKDPAGNVTTYTYDALNRLTKQAIQTQTGVHSVTDYTYDAVGNLLSASNGGSSVGFAYDALNRVLETRQAFDGTAYTLNYGYDAVGNKTSMRTPWGRYSYTYDVLNRPASIINPQGITVLFKYDAAGRRIAKSVLTSGVQPLTITDYAYDAAGQLLRITNKAGGKPVAFAKYTYDDAGNRISMEDQNGVHTYRYDASNRLIVARDLPLTPFSGEGFAYDKAGNRRHDTIVKDYKYDKANRLLENTLYRYTHDLNGNLTSRTEKVGSATISYAYNPEQRLSEVITPNAKVEYKYDPLGRRIEKSVAGSPLRYVYDNEDIIAILDGNNNPTETFTHGPGIDEPLVMTKPDGADYFYHADGLGSITALTSETGEIAQTIKYQSYGKPVIVIYDQAAATNPYYFTAKELDAETGLYYYRARYYDWLRGAFTQEDPIGFSGGDTNLYTYVKNRPINAVDPSGKIGWMVAGALISGGIDFAMQYSQTGNIADVNLWSVAVSAGAGALGAGAGEKIAKIGVTAVSRIILNTGAAGALGGYAQIIKNRINGLPITDNLAEASSVGIVSGALGSSVEEVANMGITKSAEWYYNSLPWKTQVLIESNAVTHVYFKPEGVRNIVTAAGLGISSSGDLYGCK